MDERAIETYPMRVLIAAVILVSILLIAAPALDYARSKFMEQKIRKELLTLCDISSQCVGQRKLELYIPAGAKCWIDDGIWYDVGHGKQFLPCDAKIKAMNHSILLEGGTYELELRCIDGEIWIK